MLVSGDIHLVNAAGDIIVNRALRVPGSGDITLDAGTGGISSPDRRGTLSSGSGDLTLTSDTIALGASVASSGGTLVLQPATGTQGIGIGRGPGGYQFSDREIGHLTDGFSRIYVGRSGGQHTFNIARTQTFKDPVIFRGRNANITDALETGLEGESMGFEMTGDINVDDVVSVHDQSDDVVLEADGDHNNDGDLNVGGNNNGQLVGRDVMVSGHHVNIGDGNWLGRINSDGNVSITATGDFVLPRRGRIIADGNITIQANGNVRIDGLIRVSGTGTITIESASGTIILGQNDHVMIVNPGGDIVLDGTLTSGGFGNLVRLLGNVIHNP